VDKIGSILYAEFEYQLAQIENEVLCNKRL